MHDHHKLIKIENTINFLIFYTYMVKLWAAPKSSSTLTFLFHDSGNAGQSDFPLLGIDKAWTWRGYVPYQRNAQYAQNMNEGFHKHQLCQKFAKNSASVQIYLPV